MAQSTNAIDMVNGPLWGKILKFSVLYMLTALLQQLYSAADVIVVGRFAGQDALAGVGTCTVIVNLFLNFILGLSAGGTIVLGHALGARSNDAIGKAAHTCMAVAVSGGLIVSLICLLFTKQLLNMIDVPKTVMPQATAYLRIISIGYIPSLIYNFGAAILRAKGDTKRALYIVMISGIVNVLLNLFFVCVLKMKAGGVATATVISQVLTAIAILYILLREPDATRISLGKIRFYKAPFLKILKYGLPSGIQSSVYSASNILVQSSVNGFGSAAIAGSSVTSSITDFYSVTLNGLFQSSIVFSSQNYGAVKFERIKRTIVICVTYVLGLWALQALITALCGKFLIGLYTPDDPLAAQWAWRKLQVIGYVYGLMGLMNVMSGALRGMGESFLNMTMSIVGVCGIRLVWIWTAFRTIGTYESLFVCYPLSWLGTLLLHTAMFVVIYKKKKKRLVLNTQ